MGDIMENSEIKSEELLNEDIRKILLEMLKKFDEVCLNYGIVYSAFAGTLLGAVRHQGFIPWDDDIDIFMFRDEYERLIDLIKEKNPFRDEILIYDTKEKKKYSLPLAKLIDTKTILTQNNHAEKCTLGVYIDIFIYDRVPEDNKRRRKLFHLADKLQHMWYLCDFKPQTKGDSCKGHVKYVIRKILNHGFARCVAKKMEEIAKSSTMKNKDSTLLGNLLYCSNREQQLISYSDLLDVKRTKFENQEICIIKEYDSFLTKHFGNYMEFPPEEQRVSTHTFTCKWK